jgi:hypothetical protein
MIPQASILRRPWGLALALALLLSLNGCAVIAVADLAATAVVGTAGLVVDAAVGTVRIGGKVIGATANAVIPDDDEDD